MECGSMSKRPKRRDVRVVDGDGLENRCAKAPGVRIPLSPPTAPPWAALTAEADKQHINSAWRSTQEAEGAPLLRE